jgi:hypothetical protein
MTEKKKKEENTSSETPKKKPGRERLSSMIESMQKRGSPVNAHKVATKYFDSFRKERNIPPGADAPPKEDSPTAVESPDDSAVTTAVDTTKSKRAPEKRTTKKAERKSAGQNEMDETLSPSEAKIYRAMLEFCREKEADSYRFGLKTLKELTGLSDKTVRKSIHSLEEKLCIEVIEPSVGIYGRKFRVLEPTEALGLRAEAGVEIDPTTKMVTEGPSFNRSVSTAVGSKVGSTKNNAVPIKVDTPVSNAVSTAVRSTGRKMAATENKVEGVYRKYTGNSWGAGDRKFYRSIATLDMVVIETAVILSTLKGEGGMKSLSDAKDVLLELGDSVPEGYLTELRKVWEKVNEN